MGNLLIKRKNTQHPVGFVPDSGVEFRANRLGGGDWVCDLLVANLCNCKHIAPDCYPLPSPQGGWLGLDTFDLEGGECATENRYSILLRSAGYLLGVGVVISNYNKTTNTFLEQPH